MENWILKNKLKVDRIEDILIINHQKFYLIPPKEGKLFNKDFSLILSDEEKKLSVDYYIFEFGGEFYYLDKDDWEHPYFERFEYIGEADQEIVLPFAHLGVHGKYEVLNGSGEYERWCKKAKFLGHEALGIIEENTLGGIIPFQFACEENNIKPIIGESVSVKFEDAYLKVKLYCIDKTGWKSLLKINKEVNITNEEATISFDKLLAYSEGLAIVLGNNWVSIYSIIYYTKLKKAFRYIYQQIDTVIWNNKKFDLEFLNNYKSYIKNALFPFILVNDSYYLEQEEWKVKKFLNKIGDIKFVNSSFNQHYKGIDESFNTWISLFKEEDTDNGVELFKQAVDNAYELAQICNFKLEFGKFHLPKFNMSDIPEQYKDCETSMDLFWELIEEGAAEKLMGDELDDMELYSSRIDQEFSIIQKGGFIDYFLILWDIIRYCKENNILTGLGRGSAAGSLISYLLGITKINPIKYNLLFERFLNEARINKSLPDIDLDFEAGKREEIKKYIEIKYGSEMICNIGSYDTFKIKSGLKDLVRVLGGNEVNYDLINDITTKLRLPEEKDGYFEELFIAAQKNDKLKTIIQNNGGLINLLFYVLNLPKAKSVHPSAIIIIPKYEGENIFDYIPLRQYKKMFVSDWEGEYLENAGFLKEDILGLFQLDKFKFMLSAIKENEGKDIDIYNVPLNEPEVMDLFKKGCTADIFQFNTSGLTPYCKEVEPDGVEELTNMVALYRPGPIQSNAHNDYVKYKFNRSERINYDFGLKEVTKNTFGLYIFQEQVMQAVQILGGFNPSDTDEVRRAMGKKKEEVIKPYKAKFIDYAVKEMSCPQIEAEKIWKKLEVFSGYGFNKSHAASYAITGYISQWFKYHYPIYFWGAAFQYVDPANKATLINRFVAEIDQLFDFIKIVPPHINNSDANFKIDPKEYKIYWSLQEIAYLGPVALEEIIKKRQEKGAFYSFEDFLKRVNKTSIDKRVIVNLILSGAFDEIEEIIDIRKRKLLIERYYNFRKEKQAIILADPILTDLDGDKEWWWILKQKEISNLGLFNYKQLLKDNEFPLTLYLPSNRIESIENRNRNVVAGGILVEVIPRASKNGPWGLAIIDSNYYEIGVYFWNESYKIYASALEKNLGNIMLISGTIKEYGNDNFIHITEDSKVVFL